jgi:hypothetical protein
MTALHLKSDIRGLYEYASWRVSELKRMLDDVADRLG